MGPLNTLLCQFFSLFFSLFFFLHPWEREFRILSLSLTPRLHRRDEKTLTAELKLWSSCCSINQSFSRFITTIIYTYIYTHTFASYTASDWSYVSKTAVIQGHRLDIRLK